MATEETNYTARLIGPEGIEAGRTQVLTCPVYRSGALVAPTSGTVSLYDAANQTIVNAATVTITSSVATYSLNASLVPTTLNYGDGWRLEWALLMADGVVHTFRRDAALVRRRLYPVVTDADLIRLHSDLGSSRIRPSGLSSLQDYLDEAWAQIDSWIHQQGKRPWLVMDPSAFRSLHLYWTLSILFRDFSTGQGEGGRWEALADLYEQKTQAEKASINFLYDESNTGNATATKASGPSVLFLTSRPAPRFRTAW